MINKKKLFLWYVLQLFFPDNVDGQNICPVRDASKFDQEWGPNFHIRATMSQHNMI